MEIIREIMRDYEYGRQYKLTTFKNEHGIFLFDEKDKDIHKWSGEKGWTFICRKISDINEACDLIDSMFRTSEVKNFQKVLEVGNFLLENTSELSDDEVIKIVNIIKNAVREWRLLPGSYEEEKNEVLEQLSLLRYCGNDELKTFFTHSGNLFFRLLPEEIKNKLICIMAFKEAA